MIGVVSKATRILRRGKYPARRASSIDFFSRASPIWWNTRLASNSCKALFCIGTSSISNPKATFQRRSYFVRSTASAKLTLVGPQEQHAHCQAGGNRGPSVIRTIQGGKVLIAKQVLPMLSQIAVDRLSPHMIHVQLVRGEHPALRGAFPHHGLSSCRCPDFFRRGAAWPFSCLRSGKRTNSKWVRSSTFQVTVSPGSKSKAAARGRGRLA